MKPMFWDLDLGVVLNQNVQILSHTWAIIFLLQSFNRCKLKCQCTLSNVQKKFHWENEMKCNAMHDVQPLISNLNICITSSHTSHWISCQMKMLHIHKIPITKLYLHAHLHLHYVQKFHPEMQCKFYFSKCNCNFISRPKILFRKCNAI